MSPRWKLLRLGNIQPMRNHNWNGWRVWGPLASNVWSDIHCGKMRWHKVCEILMYNFLNIFFEESVNMFCTLGLPLDESSRGRAMFQSRNLKKDFSNKCEWILKRSKTFPHGYNQYFGPLALLSPMSGRVQHWPGILFYFFFPTE